MAGGTVDRETSHLYGIETGADWASLGSLLRRAGYTTDAVRRYLRLTSSVQEILSNTIRFTMRYHRRLAQSGEPVAVLAQLFLLSTRVPARSLATLDRALAVLLWQLGLVEPVKDDPDLLRGTVAITELDGCYFISDKIHENRSPELTVYDYPNLCMPPHASSIELLRSLRRPPGARSFLDVGCGTGCQSILFGAQYERVTGFDLSSRSVQYAQVNSRLNLTTARFIVSDWESFPDDERYDHVVFNAPNADTAFEFINSGLDRVLAPSGTAQIWLTGEITASDGDIHGLMKRRTRHHSGLAITAQVNEDSLFALPADYVRAGKLPFGNLLVLHPTEQASYFTGLAERHVVEVASVVLTMWRKR